MIKQKKINLYKVILRRKYSDWNENILVYENLFLILRNSDKVEEICNIVFKLYIIFNYKFNYRFLNKYLGI